MPNVSFNTTFDVVFHAHSTPNTYRKLDTTGPSARGWMNFGDLGEGNLLLFGGRDTTFSVLNDTWIFETSTSTWSEVTPETSPLARDGYAMASGLPGQVIMFGGRSTGPDSTTTMLNDTWVFDQSTGQWTELHPSNPPEPRRQHKMVNIGNNKILLFGGKGNTDLVHGTWIYDITENTWTDINPSISPDPNYAFAMDFNGSTKVTLFGGLSDTTWSYDIENNTWTRGAPRTSPSVRGILNGCYFEAGDFIVMFGADFNSDSAKSPMPGTFAYDPVTDDWTEITPSFEPSPLQGYAMAYIEGSNKAIIFGGTVGISTGKAQSTTWEYVGFSRKL